MDVKRILEDGPWAFELSLLILKKLEENISPFDIPLNTSEFWIQVHHLPSSFFSERVGRIIGASLGEFFCSNKKNFDGAWKTFLKVRVLLDVTKPLRRKMKMQKTGSECF